MHSAHAWATLRPVSFILAIDQAHCNPCIVSKLLAIVHVDPLARSRSSAATFAEQI